MRASALDFVMAGLLMGALAVLAGALTAFAIVPLSTAVLGSYHVVADVLVLLLAYGLLSAAAVAIVLRLAPLRPGEYGMDDPLFTRWKLVHVVSEFGRGALLPFTSVFAKPVVAKLFGARIGAGTALAGNMTDLPMISVGDGSILGLTSVVTGHAITSGRIILREVRIGRGATVGVGAVIMPGVVVGDGSIVAAGSVVALDTVIPPGEVWAGVPARRLRAASPDELRG